MTRDEAIDLLTDGYTTIHNPSHTNEKMNEAFNMAIRSLKQTCDYYDPELKTCRRSEVPTAKENLVVEGDLISKAEVLHVINERIEQIKRDKDAINKSYSHLSFAEGVHDGYCRLKCDIRVLPCIPKPYKEGEEE